jgi:hypothetical protein
VAALGWTALVLVVVAGLLVVFWFVGRFADPARQLARARTQFEAQRGELETQFFQAAAASGKPRGLRWVGCDWSDALEFARDKESHDIVALRGVTIRFEAIEGSDMEGLPAVGNLRNASAVFHHRAGRWLTQGKAVFNLNPDETLRHFAAQYERLV